VQTSNLICSRLQYKLRKLLHTAGPERLKNRAPETIGVFSAAVDWSDLQPSDPRRCMRRVQEITGRGKIGHRQFRVFSPFSRISWTIGLSMSINDTLICIDDIFMYIDKTMDKTYVYG
jgi:hypothetical protein